MAIKNWSILSGLVVGGGLVLSFIWAWWAFITGSILAFMLFRANRMSVANFGMQSIASKATPVAQMRAQGLV